MNERIRELAEQAAKWAQQAQWSTDPRFGDRPFSDLHNEKFAELIVRECILINRQRMFSEYEGDSHRVAHNNALLCANSDMFEHFGVEE